MPPLWPRVGTKLGALVACPEPGSGAGERRPQVASLLHATSADLLDHLRRLAQETDRRELPVQEWVDEVVLPGPPCTMARQEQRILEAMQSLQMAKYIKVKWAKGVTGASRLRRATVTLC